MINIFTNIWGCYFGPQCHFNVPFPPFKYSRVSFAEILHYHNMSELFFEHLECTFDSKFLCIDWLDIVFIGNLYWQYYNGVCCGLKRQFRRVVQLCNHYWNNNHYWNTYFNIELDGVLKPNAFYICKWYKILIFAEKFLNDFNLVCEWTFHCR